MELAVIKTGGKQYVVKTGDTIFIEILGEKKAGDKVVFDEVLMLDDGAATQVGAPRVKGAKVEGTVIEAVKNDKVEVVKYKAKSRYYKRRGHRQPQLKVAIDSIS